MHQFQKQINHFQRMEFSELMLEKTDAANILTSEPGVDR